MWLALALGAVLAGCGGTPQASQAPQLLATATVAPTATAEPVAAASSATPVVLANLGGAGQEGGAAGLGSAPAGSLVLGIGEEARLGEGGASVRFVRVVEDSRCPENARCIWQGRVVVELSVSEGGATTSLALGTLTGFADAPASADAAGRTLRIEDVSPYPATPDPIPEEQYVLILAVSS